MSTPNTTVPIQYIGIRPLKADNVAGTGLTWHRHQIHPVAATLAQKLLRHPDVWQLVAPEDLPAVHAATDSAATAQGTPAPLAAALSTVSQAPPPVSTEAHGLPDLPDLGSMDKPALVAYAQNRFNQKLDARHSKSALVSQIVALTNSIAAPDA